MAHLNAAISFTGESSEFLAETVLPLMVGLNFDVSYKNHERRDDEVVVLVRIEKEWHGTITVQRWSDEALGGEGPEYLIDLYGDAPSGLKVKTFTLI